MFEVGFSELCMVALVALLVIGPERLPKAARFAGLWLGKTRRMMDAVKAEINAELQAEEMRQIFKEQMGLEALQQMQQDIAETGQDLKTALDKPLDEVGAQAKAHEAE